MVSSQPMDEVNSVVFFVLKKIAQKKKPRTSVFCVCFLGEFSQPDDKKKGLANPTNGFLRF
jgi:hypothetical protein